MTYITEQTNCSRPARISWIASATQMLSVFRQRQALKRLDEAALQDVGLSRREAESESNRAFWDAPDSWRC